MISFQRIILLTTLLVLVSACSRLPEYSAPPITGANVAVDPASLVPEVPAFYTYKANRISVNFFILKIDNEVSAYLDACASCYKHKQGYRYNNGSVTCRYCDMKFPVRSLGKGLGSCFPIRIEGRMENGKFAIPVSTLEKNADKF